MNDTSTAEGEVIAMDQSQPDVAHMPFVVPTQWDSLAVVRRDKDGNLLTTDSGQPAIQWTARFVAFNADGSRSVVTIPTLVGVAPASTPLADLDALVVLECRAALSKIGAVPG